MTRFWGRSKQDENVGIAAGLPSLTSMRALAALLVFAHHLGKAEFGYTGVSFFFILSGFVLAWGAGDREVQLKKFLLRRISRVYPVFLVVLVTVVAIPALLQVPDFTWRQLVLNVFLLQAWIPNNEMLFSLNGVAWSLSCEVFFYAVFPVVFVALRRLRLRSALLISVGMYVAMNLLVLVASTAPADSWLNPFAYANPLVRFPEFMLGMVAALGIRHGWNLKRPLAIPVLVLAGIGAMIFNARPALDVWAVPVFLLLIVFSAQRDARGATSVLGRPWMVYAGKLSFAFYLVHQLVIENLLKDSESAQWWQKGVIALCAFLGSVLVAFVLHEVIEKPTHKFLSEKLKVAKRTSSSDSVAE